MKVSKNGIIIMTENGRCSRKSQFSGGETGFSMPEILIVLLTISILTVLALPRSIRQLQLYRLETSVAVMGNKLMETRMSAIKRNRTSWLRLDKTTKIRSTNSAGQTIDVNFPENFPQGVVLDSPGTVEISFDSLGRLAASTQTFVLREVNSNKRKSITVSPAGKISVGAMY
jgi:Tfp pilus assembly protein FimT